MSKMPPPPPPPPPQTLLSDTSQQLENKCETLIFDPDLCSWASDIPDLRRACVLNKVSTTKTPFKYSYKSSESIIQVGPTCGLVALSMLINAKVTPTEILDIAKLEGYTNHGEMLSSKDMVKLTNKIFNLADITNLACSLHSGDLFSPSTIESLLNGALLLVPYDADGSHRPTLRNGHTAHWALVCGVIVVNEPKTSLTIDEDNIYVLCRHGKSKYLCAWSLSQLAASNDNLWEFSPKKESDDLTYVIPEGGLGGEDGLRGQYLMFKCH